MRANLTLDQNNYILTLKQAIDGEYVVPDDIDFDYLNCYQLSGEEFIFDEEKAQKIKDDDSKRNEIEDLKKKLNDSDYIMARYSEEILALDNPLTWISDVIKINIKYRSLYLEALKNRKIWRNRIEELEEELNETI